MLDAISSEDDYGWATDLVMVGATGVKEYVVLSAEEVYQRSTRIIMMARRSPFSYYPHFYEMIGAQFEGGRAPAALFLDYDGKVPREISLAWRLSQLSETKHG